MISFRWIRGGNSDKDDYKAKQKKKDSEAFNKACKIAGKNGWTIEAPGLYWTIFDDKGNELK